MKKTQLISDKIVKRMRNKGPLQQDCLQNLKQDSMLTRRIALLSEAMLYGSYAEIQG